MSAVLLATLLLNTESVSLQNRLFCDKHLYFEEQLQCHRFNLKYYGQIYCEGVSQQMRDDYPDLVICISSCLAIVTKQYIDGYPKFPYTLYRCNQLARANQVVLYQMIAEICVLMLPSTITIVLNYGFGLLGQSVLGDYQLTQMSCYTAVCALLLAKKIKRPKSTVVSVLSMSMK
ncbi:hypothetical protein QR680_010174 [Steinernema hermaphroditum]|uniref:Uncharacterized protein n=1 Tax=Steinernema hermaphroditum TaxID=289476 RepID=A0AA39MBB1_9BILA|nr:hypothetical protein QR680_010174 [Steinernema hermaphroditum]